MPRPDLSATIAELEAALKRTPNAGEYMTIAQISEATGRPRHAVSAALNEAKRAGRLLTAPIACETLTGSKRCVGFKIW